METLVRMTMDQAKGLVGRSLVGLVVLFVLTTVLLAAQSVGMLVWIAVLLGLLAAGTLGMFIGVALMVTLYIRSAQEAGEPRPEA